MKKSRFALIAALLLLGYLTASTVARTPNPVRLSYAAWLTVRIAAAGDGDKDYIDAEYDNLVFCNRRSLEALRTIVLTGEMSDTAGTACSTWPTPMYYVGTTQVGGNGCLTCPGMSNFRFSDRIGALSRYAQQVLADGSGDGFTLP